MEAVAGGVLGLELACRMRAARVALPRTSSRRASRPAWSAGRSRRRRASASGRAVSTTRAVGQDELEGVQGVVAVLHDAAAHAGGVVADHPADHGGVDARRGRGRCGWPWGASMRFKCPPTTAGCDQMRRPAVQHARRLPVGRQLHQDVVAHRLAGERRARGPEGEVAAGARGSRRGGARTSPRSRAAPRPRGSGDRSRRPRSGPGDRSGR